MDDANTENKYDQVFTFAPGEGQHPLSLCIKIKMQSTYAFHPYFVVRDHLAKMNDLFQFIIVTL